MNYHQKKKKKRIDSSFDFAPSKITWNEMVKLNLLPDIATFLHELQSVWCCEDFGLDETDDIVQVNKCIAENSIPMNEGYPMLLSIAYFHQNKQKEHLHCAGYVFCENSSYHKYNILYECN